MIFQSAKFYGAAGLVIDGNIENTYLSASWSHGVDDIFYRSHSAISHIHPLEFKLPRHLVTNEEIKKYAGMGEYEVHEVGCPFIYTNPSITAHHGTKYRRAYMPTHSLAGLSFETEYRNWLEVAIENNCDCIILANTDFEAFKNRLKDIIPFYIDIIRGAKVDETDTLNRLKNLFYSIKECVFDSPGSHIIYAILCGVCPIFLEKKMPIYEELLISNRLVKQYPKNISKEIEEYIHSKVSNKEFYLVWSKYLKKELMEIAEFSCGIHCKKNREIISKLLLPKAQKENINNLRILLSSKIKYKIFNYLR